MDTAQRMNEYEDLLLQLDSTFSDLEAAKRKGYLQRDLPLLKKTADDIRDRRRTNPPIAEPS
jgi:hypothetical protein